MIVQTSKCKEQNDEIVNFFKIGIWKYPFKSFFERKKFVAKNWSAGILYKKGI